MKRKLLLSIGRKPRKTADELLREARTRLRRMTPREALAAVSRGALLIDLRSGDDRRRDGIIPDSLHIPRTVLEWRADPASDYADPEIGDDLGRTLILVCTDGYSSSLAAATLQDLGFAAATDVIGGYRAWEEAGLPTRLSAEMTRVI